MKEEYFITCRFNGRLGNICLEIFSTFVFARQHNIPFKNIRFNIQYNDRNGIITPDDLKTNPISDYIHFCGQILLNPRLKSSFIEQSMWNDMFGNLQEKSFLEASNLFKLQPQNLVLKPHQWIRAKTKTDIDLFRSIFPIDENFETKLRQEYSKYFSQPKSYAVHVRRTDYATYKNGKFLQTKDNIEANMKKYQTEKTCFVMFSDDINWCKINFNNRKDIFFHDTLKPHKDLILMSLFDDIISGNQSSFAYVAKLLNRNIKYIPRWRN